MGKIELASLLWHRSIPLGQHTLVHFSEVDAKTVMVDGRTSIIEIAFPAC